MPTKNSPKTHQTQCYQGVSLPKITFWGRNSGLAQGGNGGQAQGDGTIGGFGGNANTGPTTAVSSGGGNVSASATATGGNGGNGLDGANGGNGAIATLGPISGSSQSGGSITLSANINGGSGGYGQNGGSGANIQSTNTPFAFNGIDFANALVLNDSAHGGNGGNGGLNGQAGSAGNASTSLNITSPSVANFAGNTFAYGGAGGSVESGIGANAGTGDSEINISSTNNITADAYSDTANGTTLAGGSGGDVFSGSGNGGNGSYNKSFATADSTGTAAGASSATAGAWAFGSNGGSDVNAALGNGGSGGTGYASAISSNTGPDAVNSTSVAYGGNGGQGRGIGYTAGAGGLAIANGSGSSTGGGNVTITENSVGGNGGYGADGANGGNGATEIGNATDTYARTNDGANLTINRIVCGGNGGASNGGVAGNGGNATSTLELPAESISQSLILNVSASGGNGGQVVGNSQLGGSAGYARAHADGASLIGNSVDAIATATAGQSGSSSGTGIGTARVTANAASTVNQSISAGAYAGASIEGASTISAESFADVGGPVKFAASPSSRQAAAYTTALPTAASAAAAFVGNPDAGDNFAISSSANLLALATLSNGGAPNESRVSWNVTNSALSSSQQEMLLGLEGSRYSGHGSIGLTIDENGTPVATYGFSTFSAAQNFLSNQTIDLGPVASGTTSTEVTVTAQVSNGAAGSNFTIGNMALSNATAASALIVQGGTYADYSVVRNFGANDQHTNVQFLGGTASKATTLAVQFADAPTSNTNLISDIVNISGTNSDPYVVQLSYNPGTITNGVTSPVLAWNNGSGFIAAVLGNTGGTPTEVNGAYNPLTDFSVGTYGINPATDTVWAVLNHSGSTIGDAAGNFAVMQRIPGDTNGDGVVNNLDLATVLSNLNQPSGGLWSKGDFTDSGTVTNADLATVLSNLNGGSTTVALATNAALAGGIAAPVPEPASLALLAIGALGVLGLRKRRSA